MKTKKNSDYTDKIKGFMLSLYYLAKEAERESFPKIQEILLDTISHIENCIDCDVVEKQRIFDTSIYYGLEFLNKFSTLSKGSQKALVNLLNDVDDKEVSEEYS